MDAQLWELLAEGSPHDQVEVLIRLTELEKFPNGIVKAVAEIGHIASCRIRRGDIESIHADDAVVSMKGEKLVYLDPPFDEYFQTVEGGKKGNNNRPQRPEVAFTGKGTALGIADWGFDFTHPNFLYPDGTTRFLSIWDQAGEYDGYNIYGFGTVHTREDINHALDSTSPFLTLNYHPGRNDLYEQGMHGTHVLDIAAGNGSVGATGIAPESDLIAVHLATDKFNDLMGLGTSVRVFDALHFLDNIAGLQPLVINMSVGSHGDAHAGRSLIEQAIDHLVSSKTNRAVVQSCGNYFQSRIHTAGNLGDSNALLEWLISNQDKTPNEIEVWYEPEDDVLVSLQAPEGEYLLTEKSIGKLKILNNSGDEIGRYYHRVNEPNANLNQILIILNEKAPSGKWIVALTGKKIISGRYQSWIERDRGNLTNQSRFSLNQSVNTTTTGSICNGFYTISVGAYNNDADEYKIAWFSSMGPTWDGRQKPDLAAPGVGISAAKSSSPYDDRSTGEVTCKTGTSMAAPYVAGAIALLYEAAGRPITILEVKNQLFNACDQPTDKNEKNRFGGGILDIERLLVNYNNRQSKVSLLNINGMNNEYYYLENAPIESMMEASYTEFPNLAYGDLSEYFESLQPLENTFDSDDIQRGDILIRRQYGHHEPVWYGIVEFVHGNEVFVYNRNGRRKLKLSFDSRRRHWELKRLRPTESSSPWIAEDVSVGNEIDIAELKKEIPTTYGKWTMVITLKSASSVSGASDLPVGGKFVQTSKLQGGERVMGAKTEFSTTAIKDIFKNIRIDNFTIKLGGEWSGSEISAYAQATFDFDTGFNKAPASLKIFIFKVKEGDSVQIAQIEGYFDSPGFELKIGGIKTKVFVRVKVSWWIDKKKVALEIFKKIAKEKIEKEAIKQGVKVLGRKAGETILKKLGPIVTAFGIGWDIGTLLNDFTIADEVALDIQNEILGDLNVRYHEADTLGKMVLIAKNSPRIVAALIASGVGGVAAGIGDIVLFKIFGLKKLPDFGPALQALKQMQAVIPDLGGALVGLVAAELLKMGIKLNPKYSVIKYPEIKVVTAKIFRQLKPMYKLPNAIDKIGMLIMGDFDIDYEPVADLILREKLNKGHFSNFTNERQEIIGNIIDMRLYDFFKSLELNHLILYNIIFSDELGLESVDQKLINELFQ